MLWEILWTFVNFRGYNFLMFEKYLEKICSWSPTNIKMDCGKIKYEKKEKKKLFLEYNLWLMKVCFYCVFLRIKFNWIIDFANHKNIVSIHSVEGELTHTSYLITENKNFFLLRIINISNIYNSRYRKNIFYWQLNVFLIDTFSEVE